MSSRNLAKLISKSHGHTRNIIRRAVSKNVIGEPKEIDWVCAQNGQKYKEYVLTYSEILKVIEFYESSLPKYIKKSKLSKSKKAAVKERDGFSCVVCHSTNDLCVDHKIPESKGGENSMDNLQTLCRSCNSSKGTKTMQEWEASR